MGREGREMGGWGWVAYLNNEYDADHLENDSN